jgi:DNA ligase (NAD+)
MSNPFLNKIVEPKEIAQLKKYDNEYYNGEESISDDEYDLFKDKVKDLYPDHPYFNEVGAEVSRSKVKLPYILGSLSKKKPNGSYDKWNEKYNGEKIMSPKLDGVSIMVEYDSNGELIKAYTRGDGEYGRDITEKAKYFVPNKPNSCHINGFDYLVVRGEAILNKSVDYEQFGKNRRAAVSGLINTDDNSNAHILDCIFYEIIDSDLDLKTESDRLDSLYKLFPTNSVNFRIVYEHSEEDMIDIYSYIAKIPYETDGLVVTLNNSIRENVKFPEHKISFKFPNKPVEAEVLDVIYDVGRTGKITPRISIKPVEISGSTISYVTGHNYKYVKDNLLGPDSKIEVVKSGDVIPYVVKVISKGDFVELKNCMCCGSELVLSASEVDLYCMNDDCEVKNLHKMAYFVKMMGIENITYNTIENLNIQRVDELYNLKLDYILNFEGFGVKKAEKILDEINKSLYIEPYKLLAAFGIKGVGRTIAKEVLSKYKFHELFGLTEEDFKKIDGIGEILAHELVKGLKDNIWLFKNLEFFGLHFKENIDTLKDKIFCLTGNGNMPRNNYIEMIENLGGIVKSGMSKKVNVLVTKDINSNSTKMNKARDYNINIISYNDLDEMLIKE